MNNVNLVGRLTSDPELKYVGDNLALCKCCLAVSRNYKNKDGVVPTDFINIDIWGKRAETFCQYAARGSLIGIDGSIRIEKYQKDGENRYSTSINTNNFYFLGHKNKIKEDNVIDGEELFDEVIDELGISEEEIPF